MANTSRDPNAVLLEAQQKGYSRILFQQGKPVCDFELTLLGDLSNPQRIAAQYVGSGVPAGSDGFAISKLDVVANDFKIEAGRCLVSGTEVVLTETTSYQKQPQQEQVRAFPLRPLNVYLRVFPTEITDSEDEDLKNEGDVGTVTAVRERTDWEVMVVEDTIIRPDHFLLATFDPRKAIETESVQDTLIDRRRKGLTMAALRDEFDALGGSTSNLNDRLNASLNPDGTLKNNVVGNAQLADNAVTANKILDGSVTDKKLAASAVGNKQLADNAVTANKIVDGSVTGTKLAANAVSNAQLANNAVTANKILDGSLTGTKLAANAVTGIQLADNAVTTNKMVDGSVIGTKLAANAVGNAQLANNAVTGTKILDGTLTTTKLAANAVTGIQLADNAVTTNKMVDGSVIATKLAPNAVNEVNLVTNSVSKRTIQDKAVSIAELANTLLFDFQTTVPKSTVAGVPGQRIVLLLEGEANGFFMISVHLIGPRVLSTTSMVNWMQRSICAISSAAGNPPFHQHQLVLQNFSTTDILTVACRAYRIAEF